MTPLQSYIDEISVLGKEDDLIVLLGEHARRAQDNVENAGTLFTSVPQKMGLKEDAKEAGLRILHRINHELHTLICGDAIDDDKDRNSLLNILGKDANRDILTAAIAGLLVSSFGTMPPVAAIAATIIVRRVAKPTKEELCNFWAEKIKN